MRRVGLIAVGWVAAACASGPPAAGVARVPEGGPQAERALPIPADLAPHIQESIELGRTLYLLDKASAIGTDVLRENVPDFHARGLAGWITTRNGDENGNPQDSFGVVFITKDEPLRIVFRIDVPLQGKATFKELAPPTELNDLGMQMFRARQTAIAAVPHGSRQINPVILPGAAVGRPDAILVYILTAEQIPGEMVFGIHYRVLVSADGKTIKQVVPLSKSALVIPPPSHGPGGMPPGAVPVAAMVSHLVTDWPLETHVFVSLLHNRAPIYVVTQRGTWLVVGEKISLVDDKPPTPSER